MTFVGKVLVVVQTVLTVCFMTFAVAVYSVQQSWRDEAAKAKDQAAQVQSQLAAANQRLAGLESTATAAIPAATQAVQRLEQAVPANPGQAQVQGRLQQLEAAPPIDKSIALLTLQSEYADRLVAENSNLKTQAAQLQGSLQDVQSERDRLQIAADRAQEEALQRQIEAKGIRAQLAEVRTRNADLTDQLRQFENQVFQFNVNMREMSQKHEGLLVELAERERILRHQGLSFNLEDYQESRPAPPDVTGRVLNTREGGRGESDLVEISLGSDDGLLKGHQLFAYDQDRYLGRITIVYVTPDRAVGAISERVPNGKIQKEDYVTTKL